MSEDGQPARVTTLRQAFGLFVRYPTPWLIAGTAAVLLGWRVLLGQPRVLDAVIAATILLVWPLLEWVIHVVFLHFKPRQLGWIQLDLHLAREHRAHHEAPWHIPKVFVPIRTVLLGIFVALPLLLWGWSLVLPLHLALTATAVFFAYGALYEWTHFLVHTAYKPRGKLYRRLWRNHRLHHFKNERYWYGVTRLEGDVLLGTSPPPDEVAKSATARTLV